MADLLGTLKQEGKVDSSGIFTMDLRKAIEKLAAYQLPQHYFYIPKLVQAAVAGGAAYVQVKINESRVQIEFDGRPYTAEELANLFSYLLTEKDRDKNRHLRHMATAINTAVALEARTVQIDSGPGGEVVRQRWLAHDRSENLKLEKPWPAHEVRTRFTLFRSLSDMSSKWWHTAGKADIWDLLTKNPRAMTPEQAELMSRVERVCPIPVFLNGKRLNYARFGEPVSGVGLDRVINSSDYFHGVHRKHHLVERVITLSDGGARQIGMPNASYASLFERLEKGLDEEPCEALLGLEMGRHQSDNRARLVFVQDGVVVGQKVAPMRIYGAVAVLEARGLSFDLSQFRILEDQAFADRIAWLRKNFQEMQDRLLEHAQVGVGTISPENLRERVTW